MHAFGMGHANTMESLWADVELASTKERRETATERKNYRLKPSIVELIQRFAEKDNESETDAIVKALKTRAKMIPILTEIVGTSLTEVPETFVEKWVNVGDVLPARPGDYMVRARGVDMEGDEIEDGDMVLIRPQTTCSNNDIVVVMVDMPTRHAALKRVQFKGNSSVVNLLPLSKDEEVISIDTATKPLQICGVKRGIIKGS
jgi:SOS-response transcriptional repressor LexA